MTTQPTTSRPRANISAEKQPNWDMTPFFSGVGEADYAAFKLDLEHRIARLKEALTSPTRASLLELEETSARLSHLGTYLGCLGAAHARDELVQQETAQLSSLEAKLEQAWGALKSALVAMSDVDFERLVTDSQMASAAYFLGRVRQQAKQRMSADLEDLASDLSVTGFSAWGRLYDQLTGELTLKLEVPGQAPRTVPVSMMNTLLSDPNEQVRDAAQRGAARSWQDVSGTTAACLNSIVGTRLTLYERRGIDDYLEPALFDAAIERQTLDAMWDAVRTRADVARRFLRRKARALGKDKLRFSDLMAPLPSAPERRVTWDEAKGIVLDSFRAFYPALADFAEHAFRAQQIDYEAREGKRPGGFCASSKIIGESRIFLTFDGALGDVQTLAHELGHAFHNHVMRDMRPWSRHYPMTLAETASTFAEQIVGDALLAEASAEERAALLEHRLAEATSFMLNIPMRFDFERELYEARRHGELTVTELKNMMLEAQRKNYGDTLDDEGLDPWFWSSKLHFYLTDISFYNFPYTFGFLFSMGLFARAKAKGGEFLDTYERLLRHTASGTAEDVVRDILGVDLTGIQFWNESIDRLEADVEEFEKL